MYQRSKKELKYNALSGSASLAEPEFDAIPSVSDKPENQVPVPVKPDPCR